MQMGFKYKYCNGFGRMYNYGLKEIKRLRLEECPNMGKEKVKKNLDKFCKKNKLPVYSESKIGRIIKEKRIYHHRQKIYPYKIKAIQTDNGSEFHKYFKEYLKENNIIHYWNYPGKPFRQGHIEK